MGRFVAWVELLLVLLLVGLGIWVVQCKPWTLDGPSSAGLAGAMFGAAAVLLGNWLVRLNSQHEAKSERAERIAETARQLAERKAEADQVLAERKTKLATLVTAEMVNIAAGLLEAKSLFDAGITTIQSGAVPGIGSLNLQPYLPRGMPFTDDMGTELLLLEQPAVDALTTLRASLSQTRRSLEENVELAKLTHGLGLLRVTTLSNGVGHSMTILAQAFEHIAPTRRLQLSDDVEPVVFSVLLREKALPPQ